MNTHKFNDTQSVSQLLCSLCYCHNITLTATRYPQAGFTTVRPIYSFENVLLILENNMQMPSSGQSAAWLNCE
jgi:hypothetical protein